MQISALLNLQAWQIKNEEARVRDQRALNDELSEILSNHGKLVQSLGKAFVQTYSGFLTRH
jgi:hypothetical protein